MIDEQISHTTHQLEVEIMETIFGKVWLRIPITSGRLGFHLHIDFMCKSGNGKLFPKPRLVPYITTFDGCQIVKILTAVIMTFRYPQKLAMYRTNHTLKESNDLSVPKSPCSVSM